MTTTVTVRLEEVEKDLISEYAKLHGRSVSDVFRTSVLEQIEDELDIKLADEAYAEYLADPVTYTADEIAAKYGIR
jgi:uncharacterized protein (DUF1778 family)